MYKINELREAIERDEIVPYFQPLVKLRTGELTGFEVLSRWQHPTHGMISPDQFIAVAEEGGIIGLLTEKLMHQAFVVASAIPPPLSLSVNISSTQFRNFDLRRQIEQAARRSNFSLRRLILEITEGALIHNLQQARTISEELKELGVRLALDDFGTGYSSLRHLQSLPFDELKVDASFVRSMDQTRESRKIAAAVVRLGHSLGLVTVAEGVETSEQAEMLLWLDCECGQGYLFGAPVPAEELAAIISQENLYPGASLPAKSARRSSPNYHEALPVQRMAQLKAINDSAPIGLIFLDTNLRYVSINKYLETIRGVSALDYIGRPAADLYPELFQRVECHLRRALQGESVSGVEVADPCTRPDGSVRTLLVSFEPARDEADEIIGISVTTVDISERKRMEDALRQSEDRHRHALELHPQISPSMGGNGLNVEASPLWGQATGFTPEPSRERDWIDALDPQDPVPTAC